MRVDVEAPSPRRTGAWANFRSYDHFHLEAAAGEESPTNYHETSNSNMSKPTANWDKVGDRFYRKVQLYTDVFDADLELENYLIAGAPYSGAVGMRLTQPKISLWAHRL